MDTPPPDSPQDDGLANTQADPARLAEGFVRAIPHNVALGLQVVECGPAKAVTRLDYREHYLGDPVERLWHTGPAISLADATLGFAVFQALPRLESIATLDLRMDYLRPARAGEPLIAVGNCYHLTQRVAFARAELHQGDPDKPTAICTATFMRTGKRARAAGEAA